MAAILAYWSDRDIQQRQWIRQERREPFWDTLREQMNDIDDWVGTPPPVIERIGGSIGTPDEARRLQPLLDCRDILLDLDAVFVDWPETFFDHPLWHQINELSQATLNLIVMNGSSWNPEAVDRADLVSEYPRRALAAQCLASLADYGADDLDEQPPLRRDFDDATNTLVDGCALSDPTAAVGHIYCDGDEIPRLQRLYEAIHHDAPKGDIATLAGHALTAIVRAWAGWNYDGPIDTAHSSR
ncbi:MAG: hypothetical protein M3Y77_03840 [Actinomycetota bacterium]|nr:hypothetical protein [Actinomycetota bacterium]